MGFFIKNNYKYWTCDINEKTCTVKMKDMDIEQEEAELEEIAKKAIDIENDIKKMKKNIIDSDKKKVNIDVLDAESHYHRLISGGRKKEEKVQVYKRNSNMTYEVERLKDSMTSEEAILIQAKRAGIDNGRIVTSITNISQDIKKLEKYGICMKKDCFDELEKIILDNYLDIECTPSEFIDNDIPKAVIDAFVQKCCNEMKKNLDEYRSKDGNHYDVRTTTLKKWYLDSLVRRYSLTKIKEAMVIHNYTDKPNKKRTECTIDGQKVVRFHKDVIDKIIKKNSGEEEKNEQ